MEGDARTLRDGDRVEAWGRLVRDGARTIFEPPSVVPASWSPDVRPPTGFGVAAVGADLAEVEDRKEFDGRAEGFATLRGRWLGNEIHVDAQTPNRQHGPPPDPVWVTPPCPPPAGGWPSGPEDEALQFDVGDLADSGAAVGVTTFRPGATQTVLVVAADDVAAVEAALRPQLGARLCVVPSRCSRAALDAAREELVRRSNEWKIWGIGGTCDDRGQPVVSVGLTLVSPELATWVAGQPGGLVQVQPWLARA